jgi:hypothetical protein
MLVGGSALGSSDGGASGGRRRWRWDGGAEAAAGFRYAGARGLGVAGCLAPRRQCESPVQLAASGALWKLGDALPVAAGDEPLALIPIAVTANGEAGPPQRRPAPDDDRSGIIEIALPSAFRATSSASCRGSGNGIRMA